MTELEKHDQYREWFLAKQPKATEDDLEVFCEKVDMFTGSYSMNEKDARTEAYYMMSGIFF